MKKYTTKKAMWNYTKIAIPKPLDTIWANLLGKRKRKFNSRFSKIRTSSDRQRTCFVTVKLVLQPQFRNHLLLLRAITTERKQRKKKLNLEQDKEITPNDINCKGPQKHNLKVDVLKKAK